MSICACGCDLPTKGGMFLPGHDQKLRSKIEKEIGGLLTLAELVDAANRYVNGKMSLNDLGQFIKNLYMVDKSV